MGDEASKLRTLMKVAKLAEHQATEVLMAVNLKLAVNKTKIENLRCASGDSNASGDFSLAIANARWVEARAEFVRKLQLESAMLRAQAEIARREVGLRAATVRVIEEKLRVQEAKEARQRESHRQERLILDRLGLG